MKDAEEFRYLILAVQREGNRMLAAALRPLGLTPSQGEVVSVLDDRGALTLSGLGELLVCESGANPSRLVDRLVTAGLVERTTSASDRRHVTLTLTETGRQLAERVRTVQDGLNDALEEMLAGQPVAPTLSTLRTVAGHFPAGETVRRRKEVSRSSA
ncbi:MarR family winged helix-turn-helix transcriptional regulator [Streptosporangium lutulentum]|uniref:DNA-binding MarR family transcriptional regulator n=1 Tax=Streptosporangium lutulentum TaxID=1461250 RepID=A0ABT9QHM2_9ACTN|nr:MarR family transcriptional regulator [Streptosporangium lutulentum]MDP9846251.1 DNA-binding MarR family transcriptional regulator [Streptosporangium lutulentum]